MATSIATPQPNPPCLHAKEVVPQNRRQASMARGVPPPIIPTLRLNGAFHKWSFPNSWIVFLVENTTWTDGLGVAWFLETS